MMKDLVKLTTITANCYVGNAIAIAMRATLNEDGTWNIVKNVRTGQKGEGEMDDNLRIILEIEYSHSLFANYHKDSNISNIQPFNYTTLEKIKLSKKEQT